MTGIQTHTTTEQQSCTLQSSTSPSTDQSFIKELAKPTQEKIVLKYLSTLKKNRKSKAENP